MPDPACFPCHYTIRAALARLSRLTGIVNLVCRGGAVVRAGTAGRVVVLQFVEHVGNVHCGNACRHGACRQPFSASRLIEALMAMPSDSLLHMQRDGTLLVVDPAGARWRFSVHYKAFVAAHPQPIFSRNYTVRYVLSRMKAVSLPSARARLIVGLRPDGLIWAGEDAQECDYLQFGPVDPRDTEATVPPASWSTIVYADQLLKTLRPYRDMGQLCLRADGRLLVYSPGTSTWWLLSKKCDSVQATWHPMPPPPPLDGYPVAPTEPAAPCDPLLEPRVADPALPDFGQWVTSLPPEPYADDEWQYA